MLSFITNKKFWLTWVILFILFLIFELCARFGVFDPFISHKTFIGKATYRHQALKEHGLKNVNIITLGDSRMDWGINHQHLMNQLDLHVNKDYKRLTLEQSGFLAIQSTAEWSITNLSNIEHIVIGFDSSKFRPKDINNQMMVSLPFTEYTNEIKYHYKPDTSNKFFKSVVRQSKFYWYYQEIKEWLNDPIGSTSSRSSYLSTNYPNIWNKVHSNQSNICDYDFSDISACHQTSQRLKKQKNELTRFEKSLINFCGNKLYYSMLSDAVSTAEKIAPIQHKWLENWVNLFRIISTKDIDLTLVLLPETDISKQLFSPSNSDLLTSELINQTNNIEHLKILDLRRLFDKDKQESCEYYSDFLHPNKSGQQRLTSEILKHLLQN